MRVVRSLKRVSANLKNGCALTIGNFDAVHIGHQKILSQLVDRATAMGVPAVVMTFDPTPQEYFRGVGIVPKLTSIGTRAFLLEQSGVDMMLALKFDASIANMEAPNFIQHCLVDQLRIKYLMVGDDFRFGKNRGGDYDLLRQNAEEYVYEVDHFKTISHNGLRVSSTYVRKLLGEGEIRAVAALLGRPYMMSGRVQHGDKRGRQWGFPTLNLAVKGRPALTGVFLVRVCKLDDQPVYGVANLGRRPTVGGFKVLLEIHLFDFSREVYGERICVEFLEKIRDEKKFESFEELKAQIAKDSEQARSMAAVERQS